jgi:hypothetical protein
MPAQHAAVLPILSIRHPVPAIRAAGEQNKKGEQDRLLPFLP